VCICVYVFVCVCVCVCECVCVCTCALLQRPSVGNKSQRKRSVFALLMSPKTSVDIYSIVLVA